MSKEYFTDREKRVKVSDTEEIGLNVFNAIIGVYVQFQNQLAYNFSKKDDYNNIVRCNTNRFRERMLGDIPDFTINEYGWISALEEVSEFDKYALLDFIEFCWKNIKDYEKGRYGLVFYNDEGKEKSIFQNEVNKIFERNRIVFRLNNDGEIERMLLVQLDVLVKTCSHTGNDKELNKLIDETINHIIKPKFEDRQIALEKLWDAYERLKAYYDDNKKKSVKRLIQIAS
ncbi:MAG: AbiJ-NTD4 domain-containing protein [Clostridium sp.]